MAEAMANARKFQGGLGPGLGLSQSARRLGDSKSGTQDRAFRDWQRAVFDTLLRVLSTQGLSETVACLEREVGITASSLRQASRADSNQEQRLRNIFDRCDTNKDGNISKAELENALRRNPEVANSLRPMQSSGFVFKERRCKCGNVLMPDSNFCRNCGGQWKDEERKCDCGNVLMPDSNFCRSCGKLWKGVDDRPNDRIEELFQTIDVDGSRGISWEELRTFVPSEGNEDPLTLGTSELLTYRFREAAVAQKRVTDAIKDEMSAQGQRMKELCETLKRIRLDAEVKQKIAGREAAAKRDEETIQQATAEHVRRLSLDQALRKELEHHSKELRELQASLAGADASHKETEIMLAQTLAQRDNLRMKLAAKPPVVASPPRAAASPTRAAGSPSRARAEPVVVYAAAPPSPSNGAQSALNGAHSPQNVAADVQKVQALIKNWDGPHGSRLVADALFRKMAQGRSTLGWNNDEVWTFAEESLTQCGIAVDHQVIQHAWYEVFHERKLTSTYSLDAANSLHFVHHCLEVMLKRLQNPKGWARQAVQQDVHLRQPDHPLNHADKWVREHIAQPATTQHMEYPNGINVDMLDFANQCISMVAQNWSHRQRLLTVIECGDHIRAALWAYYECDADHNGYLDWNTGEIRNFIKSVFWQHGMTHPNEEQMYMMYLRFDSTHSHRLVAVDCVCMVDALLRGCVILQELPQGALVPSQPEGHPRIIRAQTTQLPPSARAYSPTAMQPGRVYSPTAMAAHAGSPLASPHLAAGQPHYVRAQTATRSAPLRPMRR